MKSRPDWLNKLDAASELESGLRWCTSIEQLNKILIQLAADDNLTDESKRIKADLIMHFVHSKLCRFKPNKETYEQLLSFYAHESPKVQLAALIGENGSPVLFEGSPTVCPIILKYKNEEIVNNNWTVTTSTKYSILVNSTESERVKELIALLRVQSFENGWLTSSAHFKALLTLLATVEDTDTVGLFWLFLFNYTQLATRTLSLFSLLFSLSPLFFSLLFFSLFSLPLFSLFSLLCSSLFSFLFSCARPHPYDHTVTSSSKHLFRWKFIILIEIKNKTKHIYKYMQRLVHAYQSMCLDGNSAYFSF